MDTADNEDEEDEDEAEEEPAGMEVEQKQPQQKEEEELYLVKWRGLSYDQCTWEEVGPPRSRGPTTAPRPLSQSTACLAPILVAEPAAVPSTSLGAPDALGPSAVRRRRSSPRRTSTSRGWCSTR